jgi:hypothetical protein
MHGGSTLVCPGDTIGVCSGAPLPGLKAARAIVNAISSLCVFQSLGILVELPKYSVPTGARHAFIKSPFLRPGLCKCACLFCPCFLQNKSRECVNQGEGLSGLLYLKVQAIEG